MTSQSNYVWNTVTSVWTNPNNINQIPNSICGVSAVTGNQTSHNFVGSEFIIPAGATILGINVLVYRFSADGDDYYTIELRDVNGFLTPVNGTPGTGTNCGGVVSESFGAADDLWGGTWTPEHINSTSFQIRLTHVKSGKVGQIGVDAIYVTVYYEVQVTGFKKLQYATEPPTPGAFNKLKYVSEPPVPGAWNKLAYEGE